MWSDDSQRDVSMLADAPLFIANFTLLNDAFDILAHHVYALDVVAALWYNDVCKALCRLYKLLVHGLSTLR